MVGRSRRLVLGAVAALAIVLVVGVGLWTLQRRFIYFPDGSAPSLAGMGPGWEEVVFETADGVTLAAWFRPPHADQPVVIVFGGNAGNRADRASLGVGLADDGFGVLLTDYRGYGGNPGHPSEDGLAEDARAAVAFARNQAIINPLVYFGESLGAGVAIELAHADPPAALILRSPFASLVAVGEVHYPWLPVSGLLKDRYQSDELIGSVRVPTMVIAGDADSIVPFNQSLQIYEAAPESEQLVVVTGADHNDPELVSGSAVIERAISFIVEVTDR